MIPYDPICLALVKGLSSWLQVKVIEMNVAAKMPPYPFVTYDFEDPDDSPGGFPIEIRNGSQKTFIETVEFTVSFCAYGKTKAQCINLALLMRDWFIGPGHQAMKDDTGVVIVDVGKVDNRDIAIGTVWERRNGFEVTFRATNRIETTIETIDTARIKGGATFGE